MAVFKPTDSNNWWLSIYQPGGKRKYIPTGTPDKEIAVAIEANVLKAAAPFARCPHFKPSLIDAVLEELPASVKVPDDEGWEFIKRYADEPGAITVVERETESDGFVIWEEEYWAVGVKPKSFSVGAEILIRALKKCDITDVDVGLIERKQRENMPEV